MSKAERQMLEDRAVRDAARALVDADVAQLKSTFSGKSIAKRVSDRVSDGAKDIFDEAVDAADDHKGALATLIAAVVLWFAHFPLKSLFSDDQDENAEENTTTHDENVQTDDI